MTFAPNLRVFSGKARFKWDLMISIGVYNREQVAAHSAEAATNYERQKTPLPTRPYRRQEEPLAPRELTAEIANRPCTHALSWSSASSIDSSSRGTYGLQYITLTGMP